MSNVFWKQHDNESGPQNATELKTANTTATAYWLEHIKLLKEEYDTRMLRYQEASNQARNFSMLPGSGLLTEHYDADPVAVGAGWFGVVLKASRNGQEYAIKMFTSDNFQVAAKEVTMLLYTSMTPKQHECERVLISYTSHFRAKLGAKYYQKLLDDAQERRAFEIAAGLGGGHQNYLKKAELCFVETRFEKGSNMEHLIQANADANLRSAGPALSFQQNLAVFLSLVAAVRCLHRNFIYHEDIYPRNIVIVDYVPDSTTIPHAVLLDFGIACMIDHCAPATQYAFQQEAQTMKVDRDKQYMDILNCLDAVYDWLDGAKHFAFPINSRIFPSPKKSESTHAPLWDVVEKIWPITHRKQDEENRDLHPTLEEVLPLSANEIYTELNALVIHV
jgi:serine/threonine protein kinase